MMKLKFILPACLMALSMGFVACGDDDDDDVKKPNQESGQGTNTSKDSTTVVQPTDSTVVTPSDSTANVNSGITSVAKVIEAGQDSVVFTVKGTVSGINATYGNFMLKDETGEIKIYGTLHKDGSKATKNNPNPLADYGVEEGDIVTVKGAYLLYKNASTGAETPELIDVQVLAVEKGQGTVAPTDSTAVTPTPTDSTSTAESINVAKALELAGQLEQGKYSGTEYVIVGYIVSEPTWSEYKDKTTGEVKNYNVQFKIADSADATDGMLVYNPKDWNNEYFMQPSDSVQVGKQVVIKGQLQNFKGTLEISKCFIQKI